MKGAILQEKRFYLCLLRLPTSVVCCSPVTFQQSWIQRSGQKTARVWGCRLTVEMSFHWSTPALWNTKKVYFGASTFWWQRVCIQQEKALPGLEEQPHRGALDRAGGLWFFVFTWTYPKGYLLALVLAQWNRKARKVSQASDLHHFHNNWPMRYLKFL